MRFTTILSYSILALTATAAPALLLSDVPSSLGSNFEKRKGGEAYIAPFDQDNTASVEDLEKRGGALWSPPVDKEDTESVKEIAMEKRLGGQWIPPFDSEAAAAEEGN